MRPILVNIPAKLLLVVALVLAVAGLVRDLILRSRDRSHAFSATPLYLLVGAVALVRFKTGAWVPSFSALSGQFVPIYAYGVMLGTSLLVGWFLAMHLAKQDGISPPIAGTIYMWTAVWSIIGSRVLWFITDPPKDGSLLDIFKIWSGGLVAYGGMIGGFLASWYGCRKRHIPLLRWADVAAPSVVLGTGITRVGCLLFGCDYGRVASDLPWAVRFPGRSLLAPHGSPAWQHHVYDLHRLPESAALSLPVHPTQIYESLAGLFLFAVLMLVRRYRRFSGQVFLAWVFGYGILRPIIEIYRDDSDRGVYRIVGNLMLSTSQIIGIVSVILGLVLLIFLVRSYRRDPDGLRLWLHPPIEAPVAASAAPAPRAGVTGGGVRGTQSKRRKRR